jgi:hypothetical protein
MAINYKKPSKIVTLDGDPNVKYGGIVGRHIRECPKRYLLNAISKGDTFMHDNAYTFCARTI